MPSPVCFVSGLLASFAVLVCVAAFTRADLVPASLFSDHMVIQQGRPIPVWGTADLGETVTVSFNKNTATTRADAQGRWHVELPAQTASARPAELVMTGRNILRIQDVLVGEVWLCSGQSNMAFKLRHALNGSTEVATANHPRIRHFKVRMNVPETPAGTVDGEWQVCAPQVAGEFTAVGYFFARKIAQQTGLPVGLVNASIGGTPVETWIDEPTLRGDPAFSRVWQRRQKAIDSHPAAFAAYQKTLAVWEEERAAAQSAGKSFDRRKPSIPVGPGHPRMPATGWNGMIHPLVPFALRGVLWYQAEDNWDRPGEYAPLFIALIKQWRRAWGRDTGDDILPFYFVQISNEKADGLLWPAIREAQQTALALPHTGMAVTIDIGDPKNIHPRNKQEVGRRLALIAEANLYGKTVEFRGPTMIEVTLEGAALRVRFAHADGLAVRGEGDPSGFEIAGTDRVFARAVTRIDGESVIVSSASVPRPVALRYAWADSPRVNLYNSAGLPAVPFRTDDWPRRSGEKSTVEITR
ncbi:sialate O-acetylesterase [Opitutaceae bacterium TAV4]|nr:sialate O-acetylesterase [Opitutaceae bacterium TAV4]RRK01927.1 sialate O-acetylesterase [Opitutaceae bacterium TAV3]